MKTLKRFFTDQRVSYWFFLIALILPNVAMFFTESTSTFTRALNVMLPLGFYTAMLTLKRRPGVMFWWLFIFIFIDAFQIVLLFLYGESPIAVDMFLNVLTTNVTEANELLGNLLTAMAVVIVVYAGSIVMSVVSIKSRDRLSEGFVAAWRRIGLVILVAALCLLPINYYFHRKFAVSDHIFPINGLYNLCLAIERSSDGITRADDWRGFSHGAVSERGDSVPEVYVLIIGETARADNFGIYGYERPTTPRLAALDGQTVVFTNAITMSNTTHKSVPLLLSAVASEGSMDSLYTQTGVISAFADAGFNTAYYSNQRRNHSFIDRFGSEAQQVKFLKDSLLLANVLDEELLPLVDKTLSGYHGGKLFIVLHTYGSHFKYADRYPASMATFKPDEAITAELKYRDQLVNGYDNTIHYADYIVGSVIERLDSLNVPAAVVYTSDHGEDIFDDSRGRFLHASPLPTYYQIHVPLVVWASSEYRDMEPAKWSALQANSTREVSTNMSLFHTMLDLAGIDARLLRRDLSLASDSYVAGNRLYVTDHNEFVPVEQSGLKQSDCGMLRNLSHDK